MSQLRDLARTDCLDLIARGAVGRVAVCTPDGPHLVPVNYAVVDETVVVRTSAYSILGTYARGALVAFEVDHVEPGTRAGWSVLVRGRCFVETDPRVLVRLRSALGESWVGGSRTLYLRLPLEQVSGRAVGSHVGDAVVAPRSDVPI
jgi:uncharacterized protein